MEIVDFGKNTYQTQIDFKFDCISHAFVLEAVKTLLVGKKVFSSVVKGDLEGQTVLSQGNGTKESPYLQLKLSPNQILLWGGWYVSYEKWREWNAYLSSQIGEFLMTFPVEVVQSLTSTAGALVPRDRLRSLEKIGTLTSKDALTLGARFVPDEFLVNGSGAGILSLWGKDGKERLDIWAAPDPGSNELSFVLTLFGNVFDPKVSINDSLRMHGSIFETSLRKFHSGLLSFLVENAAQ